MIWLANLKPRKSWISCIPRSCRLSLPASFALIFHMKYNNIIIISVTSERDSRRTTVSIISVIMCFSLSLSEDHVTFFLPSFILVLHSS
jgi:hypothetical protein